MSVTHRTLSYVDEMRADVNQRLDADTRLLVAAWVRAWNTLNAQWRAAVDDLIASSGADRWPNRHQVLFAERTQIALAATTAELARLAQLTQTTTISTARALTEAQAYWEARIIASQLPAETGPVRFLGDQFSQLALAAIVERTTQTIESRRNPLAADTAENMRRALIRGVALGQNPRATANAMVRRTEQHFNGGLTRALTIARTESLDAQRAASAAYSQQHSDVLAGWAWCSKLDTRTCPSCWSQHGRLHPLGEPGPHDHPQGRCSRVNVTKSWAELGIATPEPPSALPDAQARFRRLPRAEQLAVMGPARLQALEDGHLGWDQLSVNVRSSEWRDSWVAVSVRRTQDAQRVGSAVG